MDEGGGGDGSQVLSGPCIIQGSFTDDVLTYSLTYEIASNPATTRWRPGRTFTITN